MQIPNHENAVIAEQKIRDYLLSETHAIGRYKATFFSSLGYSADNPDALSADLLNMLILDAQAVDSSEYGKKYEIRGSIHGPSDSRAKWPNRGYS